MTENPRRFPTPLVIAGVLLIGLAVLVLLSWFGVGPFGSLGVFILSNVAGFFALLVLGVLGGAFLGMLVAHRVFAQQEFTPFERATMESLSAIRANLEDVRETQQVLVKRLDALEDERARK